MEGRQPNKEEEESRKCWKKIRWKEDEEGKKKMKKERRRRRWVSVFGGRVFHYS